MKQVTEQAKREFRAPLQAFAGTLVPYINTDRQQWTIKGIIDASKSIHALTSDTKLISKILEIQLLPKIMSFAETHGYTVVLPDHQNYYPDFTFVSDQDESIKFAVDVKSAYRIPDKPWLCSGFTLGTYRGYFAARTGTKNIQFPYSCYSGHWILGIVYDRNECLPTDECRTYALDQLRTMKSVISNLQVFVAEKWKIAGDKAGSGNTGNIGSIDHIRDIVAENGMFANLGEDWFDDYWMNYNTISVRATRRRGASTTIRSLDEFVRYRNGDTNMIVKRNRQR